MLAGWQVRTAEVHCASPRPAVVESFTRSAETFSFHPALSRLEALMSILKINFFRSENFRTARPVLSHLPTAA